MLQPRPWALMPGSPNRGQCVHSLTLFGRYWGSVVAPGILIGYGDLRRERDRQPLVGGAELLGPELVGETEAAVDLRGGQYGHTQKSVNGRVLGRQADCLRVTLQGTPSV